MAAERGRGGGLAPDLEVADVVKTFPGHVAVDGVSFAIPRGSFFSILGPSGCGKTTLLRMIAGFGEPDRGDIRIGGRSVLGVPPNRRPVNLIFQHLALFPMMNVAENVAYGLRRRRVPSAEIRAKVEAMLERVGLAGFGPRRIDQLSGGQRQRVAIARALVLDPTVLLLDEPLGALDLKLREQMKVELRRLQAEIGTTFVYITHDQSEALVMSDRVAVMKDGRFEQVDTPQGLYYRPRTPFVAGFVGDSNRWAGRAATVRGGQVRVETEAGFVVTARAGGGVTEGGGVEVFVRPEAIALAVADAGAAGDGGAGRVTARVESVLFNGAASRVIVREALSGQEIAVALPQTGEFADLAPGAAVELRLEPDAAVCFPRGGA
ncbi:MAG TPA: ABC transporter ATP-binding protein [Thermodesulfobacteriota bacterium]